MSIWKIAFSTRIADLFMDNIFEVMYSLSTESFSLMTY